MDSALAPQLRSLQTPAITALKNEEATERAQLSRTPSMDMKAERDDLKIAAEQSLNNVIALGLDGCIRWVSPTWKEVVGTLPEEVKGKPIADLLLSCGDVFSSAVESMRSDDSKSRIIRFRMAMGPHSVLREERQIGQTESDGTRPGELPNEDEQEKEHVITLKGQGILVYDRSSGDESHVCSQVARMLFYGANDLAVDVDASTILRANRDHD